MQAIRISMGALLLCGAVFVASLLFSPMMVRAQDSKSANKQCVKWNPACQCKMGIVLDPQTGQCPGSGNTAGCPPGVCKIKVNGKQTDGICVAPSKCKGVTSQGLGSGGASGQGGGQGGGQGQGGDSMQLDASSLQKLGQMVQSIMGQLGKGGGGGGGGGMPPGGMGGGAGQGQQSPGDGMKGVGMDQYGGLNTLPCYASGIDTQSSTDGQLTGGSVPSCGPQYYQGVSSLLGGNAGGGTAGELFGMLNGGGFSLSQTLPQSRPPFTTSAQILTTLNDKNTNAGALADQSATGQSSAGLPTVFLNTLLLRNPPGVQTGASQQKGGISGNLEVVPNGATLVFLSQGGMETVAGFYGGGTAGSAQSRNVIARWCADRPWSSNFLSKIVAPSFFDGLCAWRGYRVGLSPEAQQPMPSKARATAPVKGRVAISASTTTPALAPKVAIWAVPGTVPIGARTSVYWNTQGVASCKETSPDGSFSQTTVTGGAATVPLTAATTFTISCLTADGIPVTDYVTVQIAD